MKLVPLMTYRAELQEPVEVGPGPSGLRSIFHVTGGWVKGDRVAGKILPGGGDWILVDGEGVGHLDVRATFATDDGAFIYAQYHGRLVFNEKVQAALEGRAESEFGDTHFVIQPRFETGDPRYTWINRVVAVAEGRVLPGAVEYRVYECVSG